MIKFIELRDEDGNVNLVQTNLVTRVLQGNISSEILVYIQVGMSSVCFKTSGETLESIKNKLGVQL